jgi:polar amino acid transport system substrate-binding protein
LEGILKRGELRIGLEVGYMPFEMIDKRSGLRQKEIRHGDLRRKGRQLSLMGFDIDVGIEMAKALGVKPVFVDTMWPSIIPALNFGPFRHHFRRDVRHRRAQGKSGFCRTLHDRGSDRAAECQARKTVKSYKDLNDSVYTVVSKPGTTGEAAAENDSQSDL